MAPKNEPRNRSYIRYALWILLVPIVAIAAIAITFWLIGRNEHIEVISIIATLIMASVGITAALLSLDLNSKTLEQNERMIRLTELSNRPFFDKDTFICSGTSDRTILSVTNIGGKPAYVTKVTVRIRGKRSTDWEGVPPDEDRTVESGSVFFYTAETGGSAEDRGKEGYDAKNNAEVVVVKIDYKNFEHKDIEMKDLTVSHAFSRDADMHKSDRKKK
jgi:hypothetical protein